MQGNLRGQEWDVWTNYATFFTYSGEALHDSPWRRVFGPKAGRAWNGSHGCINMKKDIAKFVYEWADIGTPVYVNYE
jgi:lipoprotein-anchoring transpeptidase ErfK/SrfK